MKSTLKFSGFHKHINNNNGNNPFLCVYYLQSSVLNSAVLFSRQIIPQRYCEDTKAQRIILSMCPISQALRLKLKPKSDLFYDPVPFPLSSCAFRKTSWVG